MLYSWWSNHVGHYGSPFVAMDDNVHWLAEAEPKLNPVRNLLIVPPLFALLSIALLGIHAFVTWAPVKRFIFRRESNPEVEPEDAFARSPETLRSAFEQHVQQHGGWGRYVYLLARTFGSFALLGLSIATFVIDGAEVDLFGKWDRKKTRRGGKKSEPSEFSTQEWLHLAFCGTYLYTTLLALISVSAKRRWSTVAIRHLNAVLLVSFSVFATRDVFPLATFNETVPDAAEGWILWAKIAILFFSGVVVPLSIPRQYIPLNPEKPASEINPEQTASIFSMATYMFLDPIVWLAYRIPHLKWEQLPPLSDYDLAENLRAKSFRHLDLFSGASKRHIFFGLMRVFRVEYTVIALMTAVQSISSFVSPIGVYGLLGYLERDGRDSVVRPWVWISWLFMGPVIRSLAGQWYIFMTTRTLVRTEAIITQLVFEHALRIRMKAETPESSSSKGSSRSETPKPASISPSEDRSEGSEDDTLHSSVITSEPSSDETVRASSASITSVKPKRSKEEEDSGSDPKSASTGNFVGKINNLVTADLENIVNGRDFMYGVIYLPLQITLCIGFLYAILGWSAFVGLAVMLVCFPIPGLVGKWMHKVKKRKMQKTDARVQSVTETMNVLRMIKLFGWENKMSDRIAEKREVELLWLKFEQMLQLLNGTFNFIIPMLVMAVTYATYTLIMREQLSASKVFSSMTVFDMLQTQLHIVFETLTWVVAGKVSMDRVNNFLHETELLDSFSDPHAGDSLATTFFNPDHAPEAVQDIGFRHATFSWSAGVDSDGSLTPSKRNFRLKIEDELKFKRGRVNLVLGSTGSGKTSLLMALLGEMHFIPSDSGSWFNLPRSGGVAYAAQESWVQNETIKENIIFGSPFDEQRYKKVIYQCALERDISLFEAGDETEVGEKGLTLSGGQKARVTLARAIYSKAEIILLDDVLAALDVHTSKWLVDKCFKGDLVKGRTIILVTHNVALTRPIAEFVVSLKDGIVYTQGSVSEVMKKDQAVAAEVKKEEESLSHSTVEVDREAIVEAPASKAAGKLILAEEIGEGHIGWSSIKMYLGSLGGNHAFLFFFVWLSGFFLTEISNATQTWVLGQWATQYDDHDAAEVPALYYLTIYSLLLLAAATIYAIGYTTYVYGILRAARRIHKKLITAVLGTTLRWLDVTPTSRVIARCTQDIQAVDARIPMEFMYVVEISVSMMVKFVAVVINAPAFLGPGILVAIVGGMLGQVYIKAQLSVKREMSNARSPVLGHFGAAIAGLTSIRAYGVEDSFKNKSLQVINRYTRAARTFYNLNRWISLKMDVVGGLFAMCLAIYLVYFRQKSAATTGFTLNMAVGFSGLIIWWVRIVNEFEIQGNSLERIEHYVHIEQEPKSSVGGEPPAYWPASGNLTVDKLSARYSPDGPKVLHDISFTIKSGERVGVVGRTGSGKSSMTLSLLRCIYTEGEVYYDGIPTSSLNLEALRSNITIIPQMPELLSGTLRQNLDPFDQYDDATLNDALRSAGLYSLQSETDEENRITLDSAIAGGGSNLSVGQRQILALARAIVRGSKLLILDEATSAIDYRTDTIIQSSLRSQLSGDVTLITIAHRLQTIMDADKIMVLDAGRIVEFDSPQELLKQEKGLLRALVEESSDKDVLIAMTESKASSA